MRKVKGPTLSQKTREGWGTLSLRIRSGAEAYIEL